MKITDPPTSLKPRLVQLIAIAVYWSIYVLLAAFVFVAVVLLGWGVWTYFQDNLKLRELVFGVAGAFGIATVTTVICVIHEWAERERKPKSPNASASATETG